MGIRSYHKDGDPYHEIKCKLISYRGMVERYKADLQLYESMYPSLGSQLREKMPGGSGGNSAENKVVSAIDHREEYYRRIVKQLDEIRAVERMVDLLSGDEHLAVKRYYLQRQRPCQIIDEVRHFSEPTFWRSLRRGIGSLVKLIVNDSDTA